MSAIMTAQEIVKESSKLGVREIERVIQALVAVLGERAEPQEIDHAYMKELGAKWATMPLGKGRDELGDELIRIWYGRGHV
jgi:hypothetical protein